MNIPNQLKDCRFCKVRYKDKKPYENEWTTKNYSYEEINDFLLKNQSNYGVLTGINQLGVLDDDSENKVLMKLFEENFPKTFRVRDHYYIFLKGWDGKKIIFYDKNTHLGELQGFGQQVVGANSIHPSGQIYNIKNNIPIIEIDFNNFIKVFDKYIKKITQTKQIPLIKTAWTGDDIKNIPITNIFPSDLEKCPSCGCKSGTNFKVYQDTNSYFCFHSHSGGGIWEAIAITNGIKSCSEIGSSCLSEDDSKKVLEIAYNKYGLKKPEQDTSHLEPMGWALSLNIKKLAEERNMLRCPYCLEAFEFNERLGWFKCSCQRGGIKKLMELCLIFEK